MSKIPIFLLLLCLIASCDSIRSKYQTKKSRNVEQAHSDSISTTNHTIDTVDQRKVIGDIMFGMRDKQVQKLWDKFFTENRGTSVWAEISGYFFITMQDKYYNNELYSLNIQGQAIPWEYYDYKIPAMEKAIRLIISKKYGAPSDSNALQQRYHYESGFSYLLAEWRVGIKTIQTRLNSGTSYSIDLLIFQNEIWSKVENDQKLLDSQKREKAKDVF